MRRLLFLGVLWLLCGGQLRAQLNNPGCQRWVEAVQNGSFANGLAPFQSNLDTMKWVFPCARDNFDAIGTADTFNYYCNVFPAEPAGPGAHWAIIDFERAPRFTVLAQTMNNLVPNNWYYISYASVTRFAVGSIPLDIYWNNQLLRTDQLLSQTKSWSDTIVHYVPHGAGTQATLSFVAGGRPTDDFGLTDISVRFCGDDVVHTSQLGPSRLKVYPQPARELLRIADEAGRSIERVQLFNALGQLCIDERASAALVELQLSGLKPGLYWLQVHLAGESRVYWEQVLLHPAGG